MKISDQIRNLRKQKGLSQEDLAASLNVSRQAVTKWENGISVPDIYHIEKICELFSIDMDILLYGKKEKIEIEKNVESNVNPIIVSLNEKIINEGLRVSLSKDTPSEEINEFISFLGKSLNADKTYIFELDKNNIYNNTYKWINNSDYSSLPSFKYEELSIFSKGFKENGYVYIDDIEKINGIDNKLYSFLRLHDISSLACFPFFDGCGFLGIDNPPLAFVSQILSLLEISCHFIESMIKRRNQVKDVNLQLKKIAYLNEVASVIPYSIDLDREIIKMDVSSDINFIDKKSEFTFDEISNLCVSYDNTKQIRVIDIVKEVVQTKKSEFIETIFKTKNGKFVWLYASICPFFDDDGNLLEICGVLRDVSKKHELMNKSSILNRMVENGIYVLSLNDKYHLEYVSSSFISMLGYKNEEFDKVYNGNFLNLVLKDDQMKYIYYMSDINNVGSKKECKYRLLGKDNKILYVVDSMEVVTGTDGELFAYSNVLNVTSFIQ